MKRLARILGWVFAVLAVVLAAGITFTIGWRPFIGPRARALTARRFESTPARLARGEYLVQNVTDCMGCHAGHDWTAHDAPVLPNTLGAGQDMNILKGFPGKVYAPNITPDPETGAGGWSDDQLARAIREGVGHDGRALFPFMPYPDFQALSDEDFGGGFILEGPWGRVASANITPAPSGIPYYDQAMFVRAIRTGYVGARKLNQIMPWHIYRGMTDEDLAGMFAYIKTLKPVRHRVDNTEPPTYCKLCRQTHGDGNQN